MTGKLVKEFAGLKDVGTQVHLQWVIYFPWVTESGWGGGRRNYRCRQTKAALTTKFQTRADQRAAEAGDPPQLS